MRLPWQLTFATCLLATMPAAGQVRAGPEFQITDSGSNPAIAVSPSGFVVAWMPISGPRGIVVRRLDAVGAPLGPEFQINPVTLEEFLGPHVAVAPNGDFIVVWTHFGIDPDSVWARCFDAGGRPLGDSFRVDTGALADVHEVSVAAARNGTFVIVWGRRGGDGSDWGLLARRHDRYGVPLGPQFVVNDYTTGNQVWADVAPLPDGGFIVGWSSSLPGRVAAVARRFDPSGMPEGPEIDLGTGWYPRLAAGRDRRFAAAWGGDAVVWPIRVLARWYGPAPTIRPELRLDVPPTDTPAIDLAAAWFGTAWAVWNTRGQPAVYMRSFLDSGALSPAPMIVNSDAGDEGEGPVIASDRDGNLLVAWRGDHAQATGVFAQRFGGVHAAAIAYDTASSGTSDGNGVLEAGETVDVRPAWRNVNGTTLPLAGTLSVRFAPFPYARQVTDGVGSYGDVPDATTRTCTECYALRLESFPSGRPAGHLDLPVAETLQPADLQLKHLWEIHVGDSFTDVPRTSAFYGSVETVLHRGVANGCEAARFCPAAEVTREQMAVFVLKAKAWPEYAPRECTAPVFDDVPSSSPFCRWIEELVRRGVTAGCGGSSYCPSAPVTRAQTAVFVLRALDPDLQPPACTTPMFADVPASDPFCRWIEELARRGVVAGCGGGNYCPNATTTREQMAAIVTAAFGLTLYGP